VLETTDLPANIW